MAKHERSTSELIHRVISRNATGMRYIAYGRVSTTQQRSGSSLDGQRADIEDWAKQLGLIQVAYVEESDSGWKGKRPQLQAIIDTLAAYAQAGVQLLVVYELDRFARNVTYALNTLSCLTQNTIAVVSVVGTLDYTTADGWRALVDRLASAEYYSRNLSQKMRDTRRREVTRARRIVGNVSTGYRRLPNGAIEPDGRADQQRMLFDLFTTELYSAHALAETMNNHGYRAWSEQRQREVPYTKWNVLEMLKNPIYIGKVRHDGQLYDGNHEALVEEWQWQKAQDILKYRATSKGSSVRNAGPVTGLLYCDLCGSLMWQHHRQSGMIVYECSGRYANPRCLASDIRAQTIVDDLIQLIRQMVVPAESRQRIIELALQQPPPPPQVDNHAQIERLIDLFTSGLIDKHQFEERKKRLEVQPIQQQPAQRIDYNAALTHLESIESVISGATHTEQRVLFSSLFESVWGTRQKGLVAIKPHPAFAAMTDRTKPYCLYGEPGGSRIHSAGRIIKVILD